MQTQSPVFDLLFAVSTSKYWDHTLSRENSTVSFSVEVIIRFCNLTMHQCTADKPWINLNLF